MMARVCQHPYCPNVAKERSHYCLEHQSDIQPRAKTATNQMPYREHYFTYEWRTFSKQMIAASPECCLCHSTEKLVLDHYLMSAKQMVETTGGFIYDPSLYRVICAQCNRRVKGRIPLVSY